MSLELPHKEDLDTNSKLPGMLAEDFKMIERVFNEQQEKMQKLQKAFGISDEDLNNL